MVKWTGKRIKHLVPLRRFGFFLLSWEHTPFLLIYILVLSSCYNTIGDPYRKAVQKAENEGLPLPQTAEHLRAQASTYLLNPQALRKNERASKWLAWLEPEAVSNQQTSTSSGSMQEFRLPSRYLPSFWPLFFLGLTATLHTLVILLQIWLVEFRCWMRYKTVNRLNQATHVKVVPRAHRGKTDILKLEKTVLGTVFTFQRRKYIYNPADDTFQKVRNKVDWPLSFFFRWKGFESRIDVIDAQERYGKNHFEFRTPAFLDLYWQQLLSPFTVFQLFCVVLWCLDSYWQYSVFTLFMIFSFEASVVMQRIKNLQVLKGMDNKVLDLHVYRSRTWVQTKTTELVPGDLFSLGRSTETDIIPCDCLLLRGSAIVNEATLTGESIPQMKEAVHNDDSEMLNLKIGTGKVHVLFGGTRLLQVSPGGESNPIEVSEEEERQQEEAERSPNVSHRQSTALSDGVSVDSIPASPDEGCLCYALRTGFSSSQGKLVCMIESSTDSVRSDNRDTGLLLLLLLVFALAASGYVLKKGMEDGAKSKYQLLLHCVLIITSVIPPELPMQMALAVNSALITLMKMQIFCTEPFRVPVAGRVDTCLFDKTGTLTTDELVAVGVKDSRSKLAVGADLSEADSIGLTSMAQASPEASVVLGACHALVLLQAKIAGDPIEAAAVNAIRWEISERRRGNEQLTRCRPQPQQLVAYGNYYLPGFGSVTALDIASRHHFSSKLQRMSVVATAADGPKDIALVLVKGSPEAVATLLSVNTTFPDYHKAAAVLARQGMRVLALAYRVVRGEGAIAAAKEHRAEAEKDLLFAGFVAFTCRVRKDTSSVVAQLLQGRHAVTMITGDALLTAIHVAKQTGICSPQRKGIYLLATKGEHIYWEDYDTAAAVSEPFLPATIPLLAEDYSLCTSGSTLATALFRYPQLYRLLHHFVVYARMTPEEKEKVITSTKDTGRVCLMCGDGANDVGALKQADVGVALLSGFGDMNVARADAIPKKSDMDTNGMTAIVTKEQMAELQRLKPSEIKRKIRAMNIAPEDYPHVRERDELVNLYLALNRQKVAAAHDQKNKQDAGGTRHGKAAKTPQEIKVEHERQRRELASKKQQELKKELEERQARGESFAAVKALMAMYRKESSQAKARAEKMRAESTLTASAAKMAAIMDEVEDGELPMVKVGDASVAAPFTSKMPSIRGTVDIIRQGRCTLVTTIQMYQILALTCLISSYSLSVLHLDGVKYGDYQMTALGILMSISFVTVSRSKPLEKLSSVRPFGSIFHPALFMSVLGQFALHLVTMMVAVRQGKKYLPADYKPDPDGEFKANLINSVVFLVSAVQQVSVFVVNLKGPPFMSGLSDNSPLLYSLVSTSVLAFLLASESIPQLNKFLQLVPFPTAGFRNLTLLILVGDIVCSFVWDRLMTFIFAPRVLWASFEGLGPKDIFRLLRTFAVISGLIWFLTLDPQLGDLTDSSGMGATNSSDVDHTGSLAFAFPPRPPRTTVHDEF